MAKKQKTKLCKHCKTEIPSGTKICPNCNKKQGNALKWVIIIGVIMLIGAFSGTGNKNTQANTNNSPNNATESENILMTSELKVVDVLNGFGDEVLGQRAYVEITSEQLTSLTLEDFQKFANDVVKDSGYRCVTIIADSGKAIFFPSSDINIIQYGTIGNEGLLNEVLGYITLQDDNSYVYAPK